MITSIKVKSIDDTYYKDQRTFRNKSYHITLPSTLFFVNDELVNKERVIEDIKCNITNIFAFYDDCELRKDIIAKKLKYDKLDVNIIGLSSTIPMLLDKRDEIFNAIIDFYGLLIYRYIDYTLSLKEYNPYKFFDISNKNSRFMKCINSIFNELKDILDNSKVINDNTYKTRQIPISMYLDAVIDIPENYLIAKEIADTMFAYNDGFYMVKIDNTFIYVFKHDNVIYFDAKISKENIKLEDNTFTTVEIVPDRGMITDISYLPVNLRNNFKEITIVKEIDFFEYMKCEHKKLVGYKI